MEKQENLMWKINLRNMIILRTGINPLELYLVIKRRDIDEKNYEIARERLSTLAYNFE